MLILARNINEKIVINGNIVITITSIKGGQVRLGIDAPKEISINREEIQSKINVEGLIKKVKSNEPVIIFKKRCISSN